MAMISPETLRRFPFFAGVGDDTLKQLAMISSEKHYRPGDLLFTEGEPAENLWILTKGEVDLQSVLSSGDRKAVDTCVGGDLMVWSAVVKPHRTHLEGVARVDSTVIVIQAARLKELMEQDTNLGYRLMSGIASALSHRLEGAQIQLATRV